MHAERFFNQSFAAFIPGLHHFLDRKATKKNLFWALLHDL